MLVDGGFSEWLMWIYCSNICGSGIKIRYCICINLVLISNGRNCIGVYLEIVLCIIVGCFVDGSWGNWSFWLDCSVICSIGF